MSLKQFWAVVARLWWVVAASIVLAVAAAFVALSIRPTTYQASATVVSIPAEASTGIVAPALSAFPTDAYNRALVLSDPVIERTAETLGEDPDALRLRVSADVSALGIVKLTVVADDKETAKTTLSAWSEALIAWMNEVRIESHAPAIERLKAILEEESAKAPDATSPATGQSLAAGNLYFGAAQTVSILEAISNTPSAMVTAVSEPTPASRGGLSYLLVAGTAGLVVGLSLILGLGITDTRIRTRDDIARTLGVDVIGEVSISESTGRAAQSAGSDPDFHALAVTIDAALSEGESNGPVLVTAADTSGADVFVADALVGAFASIGRKSVMVRTDFSSSSQPGLADAVIGNDRTSNLLQPAQPEGAWVLPAGQATSAGTLGAPGLSGVLTSLNDQFDAVIVHARSMSASADALQIARHAGLSLLVVGEGVADVKAVRIATDRLLRVTDGPVVVALARSTQRS